MFLDYFSIVFGNLKRRKTRSWLTMIGIFIGIAAVVSLIGLGEGLRNAISSQFGSFGTDVLTVQAEGITFGPPGSGVPDPLTEDLIPKIAGLPGVEEAIPRLIESGRVRYNDRQEIEAIGSMPNGDQRKIVERVANFEIEKGRALKDGDTYKIVVGANFADTDMFGKAVEVGSKLEVEGVMFDVIGVLKKRGSFIIDNVILINHETMKEVFDIGDEVNLIAVKIKEGYSMDLAKENIEKLMRKERGVKKGEEDFSVESPQSTLATLNDTLFAVQLFVYIIASISLIVGGIGIMNTMYTAVVERTREIGIMKSIGAKNKDVFMLFFIESGFLGATGGLIGIMIGVFMAYGFAYLGGLYFGSDLINAKVSVWLLVGSLTFSFVVGSLAGITPAYRASKLSPVDALRHAK